MNKLKLFGCALIFSAGILCPSSVLRQVPLNYLIGLGCMFFGFGILKISYPGIVHWLAVSISVYLTSTALTITYFRLAYGLSPSWGW